MRMAKERVASKGETARVWWKRKNHTEARPDEPGFNFFKPKAGGRNKPHHKTVEITYYTPHTQHQRNINKSIQSCVYSPVTRLDTLPWLAAFCVPVPR